MLGNSLVNYIQLIAKFLHYGGYRVRSMRVRTGIHSAGLDAITMYLWDSSRSFEGAGTRNCRNPRLTRRHTVGVGVVARERYCSAMRSPPSVAASTAVSCRSTAILLIFSLASRVVNS